MEANVSEGISFTYLVFGEKSVVVPDDADSPGNSTSTLQIPSCTTMLISWSLPVKTVELVAPDAASYGITSARPLVDDAFFNFDISLRPLRIHPSFDTQAAPRTAEQDLNSVAGGTPAKADSDKVALRYYLRLIVQDVDGVDYWNSQEIQMMRSGAPAIIEGVV